MYHHNGKFYFCSDCDNVVVFDLLDRSSSKCFQIFHKSNPGPSPSGLTYLPWMQPPFQKTKEAMEKLGKEDIRVPTCGTNMAAAAGNDGWL